MRTHKPLGRWPRLSRRQGWAVALGIVVLTIGWLMLGSHWFVAWQASEQLAVAEQVRHMCEGLTYPSRPDCAAEWADAQARIAGALSSFRREAVEAALLVAILFWIMVATLIAVAHWIVTGQFPSA